MSTTPDPAAPTPAPEPQTPPPTTPPATPPATGDDPANELAKWKELARKNEAKAKANAQAVSELAALKASQMTDTDRAVQTARDEAKAAALKSLGVRLVASEVRVAAAGRQVDVDTLLEGMDASKFLDADGEPDTTAIQGWVDKVSPPAATEDPKTLPFPDLGQGTRSGAVTADPAQIFANFVKGQLGT